MRGLNPTARGLHIDYCALKQHVEAATPDQPPAKAPVW
jgi:hypothetical protein